MENDSNRIVSRIQDGVISRRNVYLGLHLEILYAEDIDNPSIYPNVFNREYRLVVWVDPNQEFSTIPVEGLWNPVWNASGVILLKKFPEYHTFLNVEVLRVNSVNDPGTSSGVVIVGKVKIPLPRVLYGEKIGRFELVREMGEGFKLEGHIHLSMKLRKYIYV
ncbi:hypothetical protein TanjilG_03172 [Lupinus angustifolius]|uniref:C2 domain-containing protein n=1 Tax=Lupinus angustifolius TaxID=3871 RepID=A0A4P1RDC6_LUPAN|nr:PREDICTED: uncharacterized protein LOC109351720 [Lupinus angustifolius]OIW08496.1 hypothetical protein TanjilG_03172 [Lupinus angustifolius]